MTVTLPLTVICGLDGARVADLGAGLLLAGDRLALVHLDPTGPADGTVECRVTDSDGRFTRQLVDMVNDCVSCTLRENTARVVRRLTATGRYDAVIVHLHPGLDPAPAVAGLDGELAGTAHVDTVVLDLGPDWLATLASGVDVAQAGIAIGTDDTRPVATVLASGLDVASVLVLGPHGDREDALAAHAALGALCPDAVRTYPASALDLRLPDAVRTGTYDARRLDILTRGGLLSPRAHYLSSRPRLTMIRWQAPGPLHPQRLYDALEPLAAGVLRASGRVWLASNPELVLAWETVGGRATLGPQGRWPQPLTPRGARPRPGFAGRHNAVVLLGAGLDEAHLRDTLEDCLLTPAELAAGPDGWRSLPDPFPAWGRDESGRDESAGAA